MSTRRVRVFHFTTLAVIWSLACGSSGGGDACVGGAACTPANSCHAGIVSCSTGTPVCGDTGSNVANGTACGVDQVCNAGACAPCAANRSCATHPDPLCHDGATDCATGRSVCINATPRANGTVCGTNQVCNAGACVACTAGLGCTGQPDPLCHAGVTSCATGTSACLNGNTLSNGTTCGTNQVCNAGACASCTAGLGCATQPDQLCHVGATDCSTGSSLCINGAPAANGTICGSNQVCNAGACVTCTAGLTCAGNPDPLCHAGTTSCGTGTSVCVDGLAVANGTSCGPSQVCNAGTCVSCTAGNACTAQPDQLCHGGVTECSTGTSQCVNGPAKPNGTICGTDQVCNAGSCVACAANQTCTTQPDTLCHAGATSCSSGTSVCVNGTALANGTTCGADRVCSGGQCVACTANAACTPANPCHAGVTSCATGSQTCVDTGTALANGTACGADQVCSGGQCVACTANLACTPANPCHAGITSCTTGSLECVDTGSAVVDGTSCGSTLVCRSGTCVQGPLPSAGCGNAGVAGYQTLTIPGTPPRSYDLLVPTPYDPARPLALVFVFHAAFGNSVQAESWGLQNAGTAATDGIFVFPQGIDFSENGTDYGIGWNEHCDGYDMPFFDAMAQYIESNYCVDTNRVFATGFSWGADFTNNLGCCRGDKLRAVAPASGADGDYNPSSACASRMPAFRITYGDQDGSYPQAAFDTVVNLYRSAHQCSTASDAIPPPPCIAYRGCDQPVLECKYAGMGHDLPPGWSADVWSWLSTFQ